MHALAKQAPTPHVYHDEGRLQQLQQLHQQQLLQPQQSQQQQPQQPPTDAEARQAPASSSAATAVAEPVHVPSSAAQQPAGEIAQNTASCTGDLC